MKRIMRSVTAALLVTALLLSLCGCDSSDKEIENLLAEFEYACNTLDIDAVLNCIEPTVSDKLRVASGLWSLFTKQESDVLFDQLASFLAKNEELNGSDFFASIGIELEKITVEDDRANVQVLLSYDLLGTDMLRAATFECVCYLEKWYISGFSFGDALEQADPA